MGSAADESTFVLIHSPLVGPTSWLPVAHELERRGRSAVVPSLLGVAEAAEPQWRHVPDAVRIATSDRQRRVILVGHSGAGLLLPVIAEAQDNQVAALIFVDSFLPPRSGRFQLAPPAFMDQLRAMATDGLLPPWSRWFGPDAMRELVPDERLRADFEAELPRLPLAYFEATVPLPDEWPNRRPCAYLLPERQPVRPERRRRPSPRLARDRDRRRPAPRNRHQSDPGHQGTARPRTVDRAIGPLPPRLSHTSREIAGRRPSSLRSAGFGIR